MDNPSVTRGYGLLERFLAKKRAVKANNLIPQSYRSGRILDIGSGAYPFFLLTTRFSEKYGIDKTFQASSRTGSKNHSIELIYHDIESEDPLPFNDEYFDIVTMLAVFEHIMPQRLPKFFQEIYRVLKREGGLLVITTPAAWTGFILKGMAKIRLLSTEEIEEHKGLYKADSIVGALRQCGFASDRIQLGCFELHMNTWATAIK
jgi:ubiquinone/menaquinone biosynthesis C-methylase UbiE